MNPLMQIERLELGYGRGPQTRRVVGPVDFEIFRGESLGVIGESGAGKSTLGLYLLGLLSEKNGRRIGGNMTSMLKPEEIAYIPQDPQASLDPLCSIGAFLREICPDRERILRTLKQVHLPARQLSLASYPHELSGGMQQRILIAAALLRTPKMIIADEPTASLDVLLQKEIMTLFSEIHGLGITFLVISHNIALAGTFCERIAIMKDGNIVEIGPTFKVFKSPEKPYTRNLIQSIPEVSHD